MREAQWAPGFPRPLGCFGPVVISVISPHRSLHFYGCLDFGT